MAKAAHRIALLKNPVKTYPWGSRTFISELLREPSPADKPQAELWMGTHPNGPSLVSEGDAWLPLQDVIAKDPEGILGKSVAEKFSKALPFLFKVLAADRPLSVQAHPNRIQAREGFLQENTAAVPLTSPDRTYKDENHKPEILCALRPFGLLKGFRKISEILHFVDQAGIPDLGATLRSQSDAGGLQAFFTALMTMEKEEQTNLVSAVLNTVKSGPHADPALGWVLKLSRSYPSDVGVLTPLFLNLLCLEPGEAVYLRPGELHVYLEGAGVELMANSDNVLRGGLTSKPVHVPELLRIVDFTCEEPRILRPQPQETGEHLYPAPAEEFALSVISLDGDASYTSSQNRSVEILICVEGNGRVTDLGRGEGLLFDRGTAMIIPADVKQYDIQGKARIYKAAIPL
jgi:mannose-6-phosphate isomerase